VAKLAILIGPGPTQNRQQTKGDLDLKAAIGVDEILA
jgi:hypothetical protein